MFPLIRWWWLFNAMAGSWRRLSIKQLHRRFADEVSGSQHGAIVFSVQPQHGKSGYQHSISVSNWRQFQRFSHLKIWCKFKFCNQNICFKLYLQNIENWKKKVIWPSSVVISEKIIFNKLSIWFKFLSIWRFQFRISIRNIPKLRIIADFRGFKYSKTPIFHRFWKILNNWIFFI